jgi:hypothetical protein
MFWRPSIRRLLSRFFFSERIGIAGQTISKVVFLLTLADQLPKTDETPQLQQLFMFLM